MLTPTSLSLAGIVLVEISSSPASYGANPPLKGVPTTLLEAAFAILEIRADADAEEARREGLRNDEPGVEAGVAPLAAIATPGRSTSIGVGGLLRTGLYSSSSCPFRLIVVLLE